MKHDELSPLARLIKQRRTKAGLTAREVARRAGLSPTVVTRLESGERTAPQQDVVHGLARALNIPVVDLLAISGWLPQGELPTLRPYLRAKYRDLPDEAVAEIETLLDKYAHPGPHHGEDEQAN